MIFTTSLGFGFTDYVRSHRVLRWFETNPVILWLAFQFAFGTREAFNNEEFRNAEMLGTD